jgi:hypothetical protein
MLKLITAKLVDYDVDTDTSGSVTQISIRPMDR